MLAIAINVSVVADLVCGGERPTVPSIPHFAVDQVGILSIPQGPPKAAHWFHDHLPLLWNAFDESESNHRRQCNVL
jgi:hypothetical protein